MHFVCFSEAPIIEKPVKLIDKSMNWFLYDRDLCHTRVNSQQKINTDYCVQIQFSVKAMSFFQKNSMDEEANIDYFFIFHELLKIWKNKLIELIHSIVFNPSFPSITFYCSNDFLCSCSPLVLLKFLHFVIRQSSILVSKL